MSQRTIDIANVDLVAVIDELVRENAQLRIRLKATLRRLDELDLSIPEGGKLVGFVEEETEPSPAEES